MFRSVSKVLTLARIGCAARQMKTMTPLTFQMSSNQLVLIQNNSKQLLYEQRRGKRKSRQDNKKSSQDDEDEESDTDDDDDLVKDYVEKKFEVKNLRFDMVANRGFGLTRVKMDEKFFEGKFRLNGDKITKKNFDLTENDELDLVLGRNKENPDFLDVKRVILAELPPNLTSKGSFVVKLRIYACLTIENYPDPYESQAVHEPSEEDNTFGK